MKQVINYAPAQICLVISAAATPSEALADLYRPVMNWLNDDIHRTLDRERLRQVHPEDRFGQDVRPARLLTSIVAGDPVLLPLDELDSPLEHVPEPPADLHPWIVLPRREGRSAALFFYRIDLDPSVDARLNTGNDQHVRELVNLVNRWLCVATGDWTVVAATPNWYSCGTQDPATCPGPGSRPEPAEDGTWPFHFCDSDGTDGTDRIKEFAEPARLNPDAPVVVAVLDTSPTGPEIQTAAGLQFQSNALFRALVNPANPIEVLESLSPVPPFVSGNPMPRHVRHLSRMFVNWNALAHQPAEHFFMPDHGLFAAGIVRSIAPGAQLRLVRVLNHRGVGDVHLLAHTLSRLPSALIGDEPEDPRRLIVNLSLVCDVPVSDRLLEVWFPNSWEDLHTLRARWADVTAILRPLDMSLAASVSWLREEHRTRVLVVAAAGNDNLDSRRTVNGRPEPRYPARYEDVLGVAALSYADVESNFSNRGDMATMGNGIAILGGNAKEDTTGHGPHKIPPKPGGTPGNGSRDAIVGLYLSPEFLLSELTSGGNVPQNKHGWAYWSGTSFATPIITGLAANYWARNRTATPEAIIRTLRLAAGPEVDPLDAPPIKAWQTRT